MNAPVRFVALLEESRQPQPASSKAYLDDSRPDIRVPVRDVQLTNGEVVSLYDTSGPYTDHQTAIDVHQGLHKPLLKNSMSCSNSSKQRLNSIAPRVSS